MEESQLRGEGLKAGDAHYRAFVGPPERYDLMSALQFNILTTLGMREESFLLDIGCGSLRGGKMSIVYLLPGRYCGVEPEEWLVREGIARELGESILDIKKPRFSHNTEFDFSGFGSRFDYLMAQSIFTHASAEQIRQCLRNAREVMEGHSQFVATYLQGEADYEGSEWVYPKCVKYRRETMEGFARECGLEMETLEFEHPGKHTWVVFRTGE